MKTLLLAVLVLSSAAPSFAAVNPRASSSASLSDLTQDDLQYLANNLFLNQDDDLIKGLSPKQRDDVHKLIVTRKLSDKDKLDKVSEYLTNVWTDGLDKKMKQA